MAIRASMRSQLIVTGSVRRGRPKAIERGDHEWVMAIDAINAAGWTIPPFFIFAGQYHQYLCIGFFLLVLHRRTIRKVYHSTTWMYSPRASRSCTLQEVQSDWAQITYVSKGCCIYGFIYCTYAYILLV